MTEATGQGKLHIRLQLEQLPRIARWLMDAGSESFSELRKCLLGKVEICQLAWWRWQCAEQVWLSHSNSSCGLPLVDWSRYRRSPAS